MGAATDRRRRYVRRVALERPGQEAVVVVTDLLDGNAYPAADLLVVYLARTKRDQTPAEVEAA